MPSTAAPALRPSIFRFPGPSGPRPRPGHSQRHSCCLNRARNHWILCRRPGWRLGGCDAPGQLAQSLSHDPACQSDPTVKSARLCVRQRVGILVAPRNRVIKPNSIVLIFAIRKKSHWTVWWWCPSVPSQSRILQFWLLARSRWYSQARCGGLQWRIAVDSRHESGNWFCKTFPKRMHSPNYVS